MAIKNEKAGRTSGRVLRPSPLDIKSRSGFIQKKRNVVIKYIRSPEVIHVRPHEFLPTVQALTGSSSSCLPEFQTTSAPKDISDDFAACEARTCAGNATVNPVNEDFLSLPMGCPLPVAFAETQTSLQIPPPLFSGSLSKNLTFP